MATHMQVLDEAVRSKLLGLDLADARLLLALLAGLGLKGFVVTDGNSPINLFNTAAGMMSQPGATAAS